MFISLLFKLLFIFISKIMCEINYLLFIIFKLILLLLLLSVKMCVVRGFETLLAALLVSLVALRSDYEFMETLHAYAVIF